MTRIVILGGPKTGKTTLAAKTFADAIRGPGGLVPHPPVRHTDDLIHLGWSEASQAAALWLDEPGPWIIEGVAAVRALRKWRDQHPGAAPPVDRVIALWHPHVQLDTRQEAMAKADLQRWRDDVGPWLLEHGVEVDERDPGGFPD